MSRRKAVTKKDLRELVEWMASDDCGLSSMTMACVMAGAACDRPSTPLDDDDFGRCHRLVKRFPQFRGRLHEVADTYPEWKPIVARWDTLKTAHEAGNSAEVWRLLKTAAKEARTHATAAG